MSILISCLYTNREKFADDCFEYKMREVIGQFDVPRTITADEAIKKERLFKNKLGTNSFGLNNN
jgi:hypothetical protein